MPALTSCPPTLRGRYPGQMLLHLRRDPLAFFTRLARQYGDVVPFKAGLRRFVLVNHPDHVRGLLVTSASHFIKSPALRRAKVTLGEGLLTSEGDLHKRQRRLAQPAFYAPRVADYTPDMVAETLRLRGRWRDGQPIDIHREMTELALLIAARTLFGTTVESDVHRIGHAMSTAVGMFRRVLMPGGLIAAMLPFPHTLEYWSARRFLFHTVRRIITQRRSRPRDPHARDFLSLLLNAQDHEGDGGSMSDQQLHDEVITLFSAGHETTANLLTFTWHLLSQHPHVRQRFEEEIDQVLAGREPTPDDVPQLTYTRMVLAESMRLYPPAWTVTRQAAKPWSVGGIDVPPGHIVIVSQWVMHRDPRFWPDPDRFDPERFTEQAKASRPRYAYFPFGAGPRSCIGEPFAWLEAALVLATLAQTWRLERRGPADLPLEPTITLRPRGPVMMTVRRRA